MGYATLNKRDSESTIRNNQITEEEEERNRPINFWGSPSLKRDIDVLVAKSERWDSRSEFLREMARRAVEKEEVSEQ